MRRVSLALALLVLAGCSSSNSDYNPPPDRHPMRGGGRMRDAGPMLLDLLPDDAWWRDPMLASPLSLTADQFQALDKIVSDQRDEIARLDRDLPIATRDLRYALNADPANGSDITAAANRVRDIRNSLFDRQMQMLSSERLVLTQRQWASLIDALQQQREEQRRNRGNDGFGGRGGRRGGYPRGGVGRPWPY